MDIRVYFSRIRPKPPSRPTPRTSEEAKSHELLHVASVKFHLSVRGGGVSLDVFLHQKRHGTIEDLMVNQFEDGVYHETGGVDACVCEL